MSALQDAARQGGPVTYVPGRWLAIVHDDVALLAQLSPTAALAGACWERLIHGAGVDGVLGAIAQEGLRAVSNFALVGPGADGSTRLIVSGKVQADVLDPDRPEPMTISAAESTTWLEQRLPGRPAVRLGGDEPVDVAPLPLVSGIVHASAIAVGVPVQGTSSPATSSPATSSPATSSPAVSNPAASSPATSSPATSSPATSSPESPISTRSSAWIGGAQAEPAAEVVDSQPISDDTMPPRPDFDTGLIDSLPWRSPAAYLGEPAEAEPVAPSPDPEPAPGTPEWSAPGDQQPWPDGGQTPWGDPHGQAPWPQTSAQSPWAAPAPQNPAPQNAVPDGQRGAQDHSVEPPNPSRQPWPAPPSSPSPGWSSPAPDRPQFAWPEPGAVVQPNPWAPGGTTGAPASTETQRTEPQGTESSPFEPPSFGAGAPSTPSTPSVHAVVCPRRHLNPPYATTCRVCAELIPPQEGFATPRPTLGVLTLSTGDTVPLDRDVVLGRAPFHADENAASRPHLVQLASPGNDISRSHVRVSLENWFVQVTDLGSTNGTVVALPNQAPVRLRPHDPFTILPGTTVTIADEVSVRFEVPS